MTINVLTMIFKTTMPFAMLMAMVFAMTTILVILIMLVMMMFAMIPTTIMLTMALIVMLMQGVQREKSWGERGMRDHAGRAGGGERGISRRSGPRSSQQ